MHYNLICIPTALNLITMHLIITPSLPKNGLRTAPINNNITAFLESVHIIKNYIKRHLQTIFIWARTSLLHFVVHWPQQAHENLWPFAINYAVHIWNTMHTRDFCISQIEHLSSTAFSNHHHLQQAHVFESLVFFILIRVFSIPKRFQNGL